MKMKILLLRFLSSCVMLTFLAIATQLPGFPISGLANVENFFNINIFFKFKLNINVSTNDRSLYLCSMLLKSFVFIGSPVLQC